jgi:hypothetical protein
LLVGARWHRVAAIHCIPRGLWSPGWTPRRPCST